MPATNISSTPQSLYKYTGKNLAPKKPLIELSQNKRTRSPNLLCDALEQKYLNYIKRDEQPWHEHINIGQMVSNLRTGKLLMMRHVRSGQYMFVPRQGKFEDNKTVGGLFQFYSTKLTAEWLSSRPERDPIVPSNDDQIEAFIENVKIVQDFYDKKFFNDQYEELESLSAQDYGTWITRYRFDEKKQDIVCELLDFPACRWDIRHRAEDSAYFIYESKCSNAVLEHLMDADIAPDDDGDGHYGLQVVKQIATQGGNVDGQGKRNQYGSYTQTDDENTVIEMWLQPEAYCDIDLPESEATVGGVSIPKGESLLEMFPTGMCVVGINNMQTIIGLYAENHKDHIVTGIYHLQSFSGVGKGISDAVDVKKEMDDLHSQTMAYIKSHGTPSWGYNSAVVTEEQARNIGKPRKIIPFDFTNAPDGVRTINDAVQALQPSNPAAAVFGYADKLNNFLQMSMQVTDFSNGLPGVDNKTATGARIGDANAEMILVPQHRNKADHRKRSDVVIFNLFKRFVGKEKFFATKSKNGITAGKYLSGEQFNDVEIDFEIVANSEVPNTPLQNQMALDQVLERSGGIGGLLEAAAMNPEITGDILDLYNVKLSIPTQKDIARVCRMRIEQAKKIIDEELEVQEMMTAAMDVPMDNSGLAQAVITQLVPPIHPKEPFHGQKTQFLAELLDCDEMMYAKPELREVIGVMIDTHIQCDTLGQAYIAQDQNMASIIANLPTLVGEEVMNQQNQQLIQQQQQEQMAQQQMQAQQQNQQTLAMEQQKANISETQAETAHQRQLQLSDKSHSQTKEIEGMRSKKKAA